MKVRKLTLYIPTSVRPLRDSLSLQEDHFRSILQDGGIMRVVDLYAIEDYINTYRLREMRTSRVKTRHVILRRFMKRFKRREC